MLGPHVHASKLCHSTLENRTINLGRNQDVKEGIYREYTNIPPVFACKVSRASVQRWNRSAFVPLKDSELQSSIYKILRSSVEKLFIE